MTAETPTPVPQRRRAGRVAGTVLLGALLAVLLALAAATAVVPRLLGAVPLAVLSDSMRPAFAAGDLVVARPVDPEQLRPGDVVTFRPRSDDPALVTHRVLSVDRGPGGVTGLVTRGDANAAADEPLVPEQVVGRVLYTVPHAGHLAQVPAARGLAVAAGAGLVVHAVVRLAGGPPAPADGPPTPEERP